MKKAITLFLALCMCVGLSACCKHTEVQDPAIAATCTETGLTAGAHCSECGETLAQQETVPATGHTEVVKEGKDATCTETGLTEGKSCSTCGEVFVKQEVVAALGHNSENGKCTRCGATTTKKVTLSKSNIGDYLHIEVETDNYECKITNLLGYKFADGTADCVISIIQTAPGELSNVVIKIKVYSVSTFWDECEATVTVNVATNGTATKSVSFESEQSLQGYLNEPTFYYQVVDVSGTIEVDT